MPPRIKLELFSASYCHRCNTAKTLIQKLIDDLGRDQFSYRVVDIVEELDYAVDLGVLSTTAIAIEGKLVFAAMPSKKKLHAVLQKHLDSL